ncbi:hypothetical protein Ahy_B03g065276 [Arachis hypogaea]|uniref:Uncharacterized protein n=1 Tax=Arachis hypogaea TaxID=3818 RepID=A0A445A1C7_ARAHY|nr:hypothetical protein Ahy_B03g065276 [Arachis hypogaea]
MVDLIGDSSHNQIGNVSVEEMDELLVDSDGNDVKDLLLNSTGSIGRVNFVGLSVDAAKKYVFSDLDVAYAFYNAFGRVNGFSIRKFKVGRKLPESLILKRWTMKAKEAHIRLEQWGSLIGNGSYESKIAAMNDELEGLPFAACGDLGDFKDVMEWVRNKKAELFAKHEKNRKGSSNSAGHNRRNCRRRDDHNQMESGDGGGPEDDDDWSSQTSEEGIDEMNFDVTIGN